MFCLHFATRLTEGEQPLLARLYRPHQGTGNGATAALLNSATTGNTAIRVRTGSHWRADRRLAHWHRDMTQNDRSGSLLISAHLKTNRRQMHMALIDWERDVREARTEGGVPPQSAHSESYGVPVTAGHVGEAGDGTGLTAKIGETAADDVVVLELPQQIEHGAEYPQSILGQLRVTTSQTRQQQTKWVRWEEKDRRRLTGAAVFSAEQRDKSTEDEALGDQFPVSYTKIANNCPDNTNSTGTGTDSDILSSSASPLFTQSLPTPLVDLETDGRAGPIQNCSVSSLTSSLSLFFPPPALSILDIDKEGYHFEGLLPTFLVGTSISTDQTTTTTTTTDRPT
ncbi:hypothetical protein V492_06896 [Pseudogymnoascus sp. VKM F-4246]|nr:hypothetical protein V492_06896 [Pseudogymnoascus sp. VKM F-4246]